MTVQFGFGEANPEGALSIVGCPDPANILINVGVRRTDADVLAEKVEIGYFTFVRNPPIKYARTRGYLRNLRVIKEQFECSDSVGTWANWDRETYDSITGFVTGTYNAWDQFSNSRRGREIIREIKDKWPFDDSKKIKTAEDVRNEKEAVDTQAKLKQDEENESVTDFVGDILLSTEGQRELRAKLTDTGAAYSLLLDRVDMKYMLGIIAAVLAAELTAEEANDAIFKYTMKVLDADRLWGVATECIDDPDLIAQTNLEQLIGPNRETTDSGECPDSSVALASEEIAALVSDGKIEKEKLQECLERHCPAPDRMFGMKGHVENFLYRHTSNFFIYDKNNLCPDPGDGKRTPWRPPHIDWPAWPSSVVDVSVGILDIFLDAIRATADELILGIIFELLDLLYDNIERILCNYSDLKSFGTESLKSILGTDNLENPTSFDPVAGLTQTSLDIFESVESTVTETATRRFKDSLIDWGVDPSILEPENEVEGRNFDKRIGDFLDEVSSCLNPAELRATLKGKQLGQNFEVVERAAEASLPCIDSADALKILAHSAEGIRIAGDRDRYGPGAFICDDTNARQAEQQFKESYRGRADESTIDELWNRDRDALKERLETLMGMINSPYDKMFCGADPSRVTRPSPLDNPSTQFMVQASVDTSYSSVVNSFNQELSSWPLSLMASSEQIAGPGSPEFEVEVSRIRAEERDPEGNAWSPEQAVQILSSRIQEGSVSIGHSVASKILPDLQTALNSDEAFVTLSNNPRPGALYSVGISARTPIRRRPADGTLDVGLEDVRLEWEQQAMGYALLPLNVHRGPRIVSVDDYFISRYSFWQGHPPDGRELISDEFVGLTSEQIEYVKNPQNHNFLFDLAPGALSELTSQQHMFANYLTEPIVKSMNIPDGMGRLSNEIGNAGALFGSFMEKHYIQVLDNIVQDVALSFSESSLFQARGTGDNKGLLDIRLNHGVPGSLRCDDLLRTNFEKKEIMDAFGRLQDQLLEPPENRPSGGPLQQASIGPILRSLVRIYVVEEALKAIFGMSDFGDLRNARQSIFNQGLSTQHMIKKVQTKITEFANDNRAAFMDLGTSDVPIENVAQQLQDIGVTDLDELIRDETVIAFKSVGKIIENEFGDVTTNILDKIAEAFPMTSVPEVAGDISIQVGVNEVPRLDENGDPVLIDGEPVIDLVPQMRQEIFHGRGSNDFPFFDFFFRADAYPWRLQTTDGPDSAGYSMPPWSTDQYFEYQPRDLLFPPSFSLNGDFSRLGDGYFVFEKFIKFEPQNLRAIFGDDNQNTVAISSLIAKLRNRLVDENISSEQVENKEAFRSFFKRVVLDTFLESPQLPHTIQDLESSPFQWPSGDVPAPVVETEKEFFKKQAESVVSNTLFWGNATLDEIFKSLKYGVRLTYVVTEVGSEDFQLKLKEVFGEEGAKSLVANWGEHCSINKAFEMHLVEERGRENSQKKVFTIPIIEELEELPLNGDDALTIANFYGAEGVTYSPTAVDHRGNGLIEGPGIVQHGWHYNGDAYREDQEPPPHRPPGFGRDDLAFALDGLFDGQIFGSPRPSFEALRSRVIRNDDFKILFNFALNASDILSFLAIYCMDVADETHDPVNYAFYNTKMSLLGALNAMQPQVPASQFYRSEDPTIAAAGGATGMLNTQSNNTSTSGQSGNAAAKTVPYLIKGLAEYQDPSYALASRLDRLGVLPGRNPNAIEPETVFAMAPSNMIPGAVGPPVTRLGIAAYALGQLPGEDRPYSERSSAAQGRSADEQPRCDEQQGEEE